MKTICNCQKYGQIDLWGVEQDTETHQRSTLQKQPSSSVRKGCTLSEVVGGQVGIHIESNKIRSLPHTIHRTAPHRLMTSVKREKKKNWEEGCEINEYIIQEA